MIETVSDYTSGIGFLGIPQLLSLVWQGYTRETGF